MDERPGGVEVNFAAVQLPATVQVQTPGASAELERKREERMTELARAGWQPSTGWLVDRFYNRHRFADRRVRV